MPYPFAADAMANFAMASDRVAQDPDLSKSRRRTINSRLSQIVRWNQQSQTFKLEITAAELPFDAPHIEALARRLNPVTLTRKTRADGKPRPLGSCISPKTFLNAFSDARFVLRRYGFVKAWSWAQIPDTWKPFAALINCPFERMNSKRLFAYLAVHEILPTEVSQKVVDPFIAAVRGDPRVADATVASRNALRVWNKLALRHPEVWPQMMLRMPPKRLMWAKPWTHFPASLEQDVDSFLAPPTKLVLFEPRSRRKLRPATIRQQKHAIRWVASILCLNGVDPNELLSLRALCTPDRFRLAMERLAERSGGVTGNVLVSARVLLKVAKYCGALSSAEIEAVKKLYAEVAYHYSQRQREQVDRDQQFLNQLDDPRLLDELLVLPTRTLGEVQASKLKSSRSAYAIQRALVLSLWFCAPLRVSNLLRLRLDSFSRVWSDGVERLALRVPKEEVKNSEDLEHFLDNVTANLFELYVREYRVMIPGSHSPWLFHGPQGKPKGAEALRIQMRNYLQRSVKLDGFHPHLIRKIMAKLILDEDPNALEIVRRSGGWKSDDTPRKAYLQRRHRASQKRYLELLESRRLQSFRPITPRKRRT